MRRGGLEEVLWGRRCAGRAQLPQLWSVGDLWYMPIRAVQNAMGGLSLRHIQIVMSPQKRKQSIVLGDKKGRVGKIFTEHRTSDLCLKHVSCQGAKEKQKSQTGSFSNPEVQTTRKADCLQEYSTTASQEDSLEPALEGAEDHGNCFCRKCFVNIYYKDQSAHYVRSRLEREEGSKTSWEAFEMTPAAYCVLSACLALIQAF